MGEGCVAGRDKWGRTAEAKVKVPVAVELMMGRARGLVVVELL